MLMKRGSMGPLIIISKSVHEEKNGLACLIERKHTRGRALARSINGFMARKRDLQRKFCLSPILLLLL